MLILSMFSGCGGSASSAAPSAAPSASTGSETSEDSYKWPSMLGLVTNGTGNATHAMILGISQVMESELGVTSRLMPSVGLAGALELVRSGQSQIIGGGQSQVSLVQAISGDDFLSSEEWGPQRLGYVYYGYGCPYGIVVRGDLKVEKIEDLKGLRGAYFDSSPSWSYGFDGCLAFGGLSRSDIVPVQAGNYEMCGRAIMEGRADFTYLAPVSPITLELYESPSSCKYIPMPLEDTEGWNRYFEHAGANSNFLCASGLESARGIPMANAPFNTITYLDKEEELVYNFVKFMNENYDKFKDMHNLLPESSLENTVNFMRNGNCLPVHPGTVRYLKEIGEWTDADEAWNNETIEKMDKIREVWDKAVADAKAQGMKISNENPDWIAFWNEAKKEIVFSQRRS